MEIGVVACFLCARGVWGQLVCCSFGLRLLRLRQGVGVSRSTLPASLFEHPSMSQAFNPPTQTTQRCEVRALMPKCRPVATACESSPKDWAVLIGSHMQQEVVIFFGASTSRRTCPHMDCASTEMQNTYCNNFTSGNHVRGVRFDAYFALSWATSARQCTTETRGQ